MVINHLLHGLILQVGLNTCVGFCQVIETDVYLVGVSFLIKNSVGMTQRWSGQKFCERRTGICFFLVEFCLREVAPTLHDLHDFSGGWAVKMMIAFPSNIAPARLFFLFVGSVCQPMGYFGGQRVWGPRIGLPLRDPFGIQTAGPQPMNL